MPQLSNPLLRWGLPCQGGCPCRGRGRRRSLLSGGVSGAASASMPPRHAVPGWIGAAHPIPARPRSAGETSATRVQSQGGLWGGRELWARSLQTCPGEGSTPAAAHRIPRVRARVCACEPPRQSSVPPPRASPLGEGPVPSSRLKSSFFIFFFIFFPVRLASHPQILHFFQCLHVQNLPD